MCLLLQQLRKTNQRSPSWLLREICPRLIGTIRSAPKAFPIPTRTRIARANPGPISPFSMACSFSVNLISFDTS